MTLFIRFSTVVPNELFSINISPPDIISTSPDTIDELVKIILFEHTIFHGPLTVAPSNVTVAP